MENAKEKIKRFYGLIEKYQEGAPDTRYKSWEWCHNFFYNNRDNRSDETVDLMALHLGFYLASCGMYEDSSYLLQRDYKAHKTAVRIILEPKYAILWNYNPLEDVEKKATQLLFEDSDCLYDRIKNSYSNFPDNKDEAMDTLVTNILMGTFACVPAFDRFLKDGIKCLKKSEIYTNDLELKKFTQTINSNTFNQMCQLIINHSSDFLFDFNEEKYPPMKCLDIFLREIGYELSLAKSLEDACEEDNAISDF